MQKPNITSSTGKIHPRKKRRLSHRARRILAALLLCGGIVTWLFVNPKSYEQVDLGSSQNQAQTTDQTNSSASGISATTSVTDPQHPLASQVLEKLEIKGRAPKTGYARTEFYSQWPTVDGCNLRQKIIKRDFGDSAVLEDCTVVAGEYDEPYTGEHQVFTEKSQITKGVQIDHVVALSDAWQTGAQYFDKNTRYQLATDPLNLLAVDSNANSQKSDGDAATWLPANKSFRCQYVARQVSVKYKYRLWVTEAEHDAIAKILETCPTEFAVGVTLE